MPEGLRKQSVPILQASFWTQANLAAFGLAVWFFAMPWSLFLLTLSMILLTAITFIQGPGDTLNNRWRLQIPWANAEVPFWRDSRFAPLAFLFLLPLVNGLVTENWSELGNILRIHLAYLVMPWAFYCLPKLSKRHFIFLVIWALSISFVSLSIFIGNYFLHFEAFQQKLGLGQAIYLPVSHIRYSLFAAMSILGGIWLLIRYRADIPKKWCTAIAAMVSMGSILLFVLAVRSGLLALMIGLLTYGLYLAWKQKKAIWLAATLVILIGLPLGAYFAFPSFKQRVHYAMYDLNLARDGAHKIGSDNERLTSLRYGMELFRSSPLNGVGMADLRGEMNALHQRDFGVVDQVKLPHNQFVYYMSGAGLLGLFLFCLAFFWPFIANRKKLDAFALCFFLVILSSFMVEYTLETSLGAAFFLGFWALAFSSREH